MVSLRLVVGPDVSSFPTDSLKTLYRSKTILIQGSSDVLSLQQASGKPAFLAGWVKGREEGFKNREGRFALAALQENDSCLLYADCFGQKDIYYQTSRDQTVFATDLGLLPQGIGRGGYNPAALAHVLCVYGYRPPKQHTLYRQVRRLGVGQWAAIRNGQVEIGESRFEPLSAENYGEKKLDEYADILLEAVEQLGSPHGNVVYLSSGWDSTALLACLVKVFGAKKVRAVIGRMQYSRRSGVINQFEINRARAIADYYSVRLDVAEFDYHSQDIQSIEFVQEVLPLLKSLEFPSVAAFNLNQLARFVKQTTPGDEMVFTGEISDGAHNLGFSQFSTIFHPVQAFREYSDKMASYLFGPTFLGLFESGAFVNDPIYQLLRGRCGPIFFDEPAADAFARRKQLLSSFFLRANRIPLYSLRNTLLLTEEGSHAYSEEMETLYLNRAASEVTPQNLYSWYLHLYNSFHWQSATVAPMAAIAEAHGFKMAFPFWDARLQKFLSRMPEGWGRGLDLNPTKYPLKRALQSRIDYPLHLQQGPHSYLSDVDPAFSHSAEILYASSFTDYFKTILQERRYQELLSPDHFNVAYVDQMVDRYLSGTEVRGIEMNELMSLCFLSAVGWYS